VDIMNHGRGGGVVVRRVTSGRGWRVVVVVMVGRVGLLLSTRFR